MAAATETTAVAAIDAKVVIIGGGIAGLATALALHRAGMPSLVLERHPDLRTAGAGITLGDNAWRALRTLGVADKLLPLYHPFHLSRVTNIATGETQEIHLPDLQSRGQISARNIHRKVLLEAIAGELPPGTVRFSSCLVSIKTDPTSARVTILHLADGTVIRARVVVGCDGAHSVVAQWLRLSPPIGAGRSVIRGMAVYPDGHGLEKVVQQYLAPGGIRGGYVPLNNTDVFWFLSTTVVPDKTVYSEPERILREVTANLARDFPADFASVVSHAELSNVTWWPLQFRVPWDVILRPARRGAVTVAGDAFHVMTPDLGQGGAQALEDAVVLVQSLAKARTPEEGVEAYVSARRWRVALISAGAYFAGWVQQGGASTRARGFWAATVGWFRDKVFFRFFAPLIAAAVTYDCGDLPKSINWE